MLRVLNKTPGRSRWRLFQGLFFIAALVAIFVTFSAISGVSPVDPTNGRIAWLIGLNTVLILCLAWLLAARYRAMQGGRLRVGSHRLARRFLLLFGALAMVPAALVALFLGAALTRGLDNWFNERIDTIVEETAEVARRNVETFSDALEEDTRLMALDLDNAADGIESGSDYVPTYLDAQAQVRNFSNVFVITRDGNVLAESIGDPDLAPVRASPDDLADADAGEVALTLREQFNVATALIRLSEVDGGYLFVVKPFNGRQIAQLRRAEAALQDFRNAERSSGQLQMLFAIGYAQLAALILLLAGRFGLEAAGQVTGPIGRLAEAAHVVREGDLNVSVALPERRDEIHDLTRSFNMMTEQLSQQRQALVSAREESEDRRMFVETLLAELSAGVICVDETGAITLANRSASDLLGADELVGRSVASVAPDFSPLLARLGQDGETLDASLDLNTGDSIRHIRLKAAPDGRGGAVLTFDDATRLVNAQRQLAWRDVARRIAHEIRNPLTPIQLSTERLKRRYADKIGDDNGVFDRCVETIQRQVADIGRMVEEFSSFARMPKPSVAQFELGALLSGVAFSQRMVTPDIAVTYRGPAEAGALELSGDERLLGQALRNLVKNAAEAIGELPQEEDVSGRIEITAEPRGSEQVEITITDNGPGFPPELRMRLLEPYVTTRDKGTGLGLAIVHRIIVDHGGSISLLDRTDGRRGARVRMVLPRNAPTTRTQAQEEPTFEGEPA